jgi:DNA-binding response OmpR family regulator
VRPRRGTARTPASAHNLLRSIFRPEGETLLLRIGEILVQRGAATAAQIARALAAGPRGVPLASRLFATGLLEGPLAAALGERLGVPGVDLSRSTIPGAVLDLVPRAVAEADLILPLSLEGGRVHLAMARPLEERVISEVRFVTGREVSVSAVLREALASATAAAYDGRARGAACWRGADAPEKAGLAVAGSPRASAEGDEAALADEEVVVAIEVGPPEPMAEAVRVRTRPLVLAVDDEREIRQLVLRALEAKGYDVELAGDGAEGLAKAEALVPDLVLLDAMLPKVHGFEACRRLKTSPRTRHVPVIMMTAVYRGWRFAHDAREHYGAEDYVQKPFRLDDLLARMEKVRAAAAARAASPDPAAAQAEVARGKALLAAGQVAAAAEALVAATRADPSSADAQYQLARARHAAGDAFAAMTALERAAELRPGFVAALRGLATISAEKGFRRKAIEALERAVSAAPDASVRAALQAELRRVRG